MATGGVPVGVLERARAVADAVLYEGYVLYPYRASAPKNRLRWQFGVLAPPPYRSEPSRQQTECIVEGDGGQLRVIVRFLQAESRVVAGGGPPWEEGIERHVAVGADLAELVAQPSELPFSFPGRQAPDSRRQRWPVQGKLRLRAERLDTDRPALRLRVVVANTSPWRGTTRRDHALRRSLIGVHSLLALQGAEFVSSIDPPAWAAGAVEACRNEGAFPVLVGEEGDRRAMLASPVIMYDHPQVAPESPGDLYDATEIDELLTLRTLALTEEEKREARATDPRAAAIIDRVDAMDPATLVRLHGTRRDVRPGDGQPIPHPSAPSPPSVPSSPGVASAASATGHPGSAPVYPGSRVRLRPRRCADAQDMFLDGHVGIVQRTERGVDGEELVAVTVEDDPAADLHDWYGRHHWFHRDEIEPLEGRS
jgi:hypothetical protein